MKVTEHVEVICTLAVPDCERGKERYQAECDLCGWHTREAEGGDGKRWCNQVARLHVEACPEAEVERLRATTYEQVGKRVTRWIRDVRCAYLVMDGEPDEYQDSPLDQWEPVYRAVPLVEPQDGSQQ